MLMTYKYRQHITTTQLWLLWACTVAWWGGVLAVEGAGMHSPRSPWLARAIGAGSTLAIMGVLFWINWVPPRQWYEYLAFFASWLPGWLATLWLPKEGSKR